MNYAEIDHPQLEQLVEAMAGQAAEHLGEVYGDNIDPSSAARQAKSMLPRAIAAANRKEIADEDAQIGLAEENS